MRDEPDYRPLMLPAEPLEPGHQRHAVVTQLKKKTFPSATFSEEAASEERYFICARTHARTRAPAERPPVELLRPF